MHKSILLAILPLVVFAAKEPQSWPLTGVVTEECAVAVNCHPMLYAAATQGREDAIKSELRVRDSKGRDVPYAFRAARTRVSFEAVPPMEVSTACTVETDAKAKKTVIETSTFGLPMTAVAINATDRNFSRKVAVFRRMDGRWHSLTSGRISAVNLPGERKSNLEIAFGREVREMALRIEIENDDNPPLTLATTSDAGVEGFPVTLKVTQYDIVFVATPGEKYSLVVEPGAERPRYDEAILGYIDRVQDPVRFEIGANAGSGDPFCIIGGKDGPTAIWLTTKANVIPFVSVIVFVVLGLVCIRLIKSTNPPKQES